MILETAADAFGARNENFCGRFMTGTDENLHDRSGETDGSDDNKDIRVTPEQWKRIENEAEKREMSPNRLVVEFVMEALERREWPRTEAEIHLLRSAMFVAQTIIRDMEKTGREEEIKQISRNISEVASELPVKSGEGLSESSEFRE